MPATPTPEAADQLERRAVAELDRATGDQRREIALALDQLRADRTNGESLESAVQRLQAALPG